MANMTVAVEEEEEYFYLYRISYAWTSAIGFLVCVLVGVAVSNIATMLKNELTFNRNRQLFFTKLMQIGQVFRVCKSSSFRIRIYNNNIIILF